MAETTLEGREAAQDVASLELQMFLGNFRKSLKLYFLTGRLDLIHISTLDILHHGLQQLPDNKNNLNSDLKTNQALQKFIDDFEWVRRSTLIRDLDFQECSTSTPSSSLKNPNATTLRQFLQNWIVRNLKAKTMCASVQALLTERELLQSYYLKSAFLRNESYANAFIIGLSAFELNQCSLLSQIDESLYTSSGDCVDSVRGSKHKRTNSHPNFWLNPITKIPASDVHTNVPTTEVVDTRNTSAGEIPSELKIDVKIPAFRKVKSLPNIPNLYTDESPNFAHGFSRPRSKTLYPMRRKSSPKPIPKQDSFNLTNKERRLNDEKPSTSVKSSQSQTLSDSTSCSTNNSASTPHSLASSTSSAARRIEIINCDDIKIWTDQSCKTTDETKLDVNVYTLPSPVTIQKTKSISPINSFLSSIFGTPPTYSTWYASETQPLAEQATPAIKPQSGNENLNNSSVFDSFMPIYGQKMKSKQNANLFEDGISTLDYKCPPPNHDSCNTTTTILSSETGGDTLGSIQNEDQTPLRRTSTTATSSQSLTAFLQMAHLSRNNTELEKENAHFRISEAIISAIEHIKWAKSHPDGNHKQREAVVGTDWLENERRTVEGHNDSTTTSEIPREETVLADSNDYIPIIEHSENYIESLSAEVVGLSLISRFNDKHLPKVSELKWLVSDEDTPQQLLPMPESSATSNSGDRVFPPLTRGTRYWAPPRAQIIFTDHPLPNRKELIRKQNNRCAGCGMRVSPQFMSSFRYCTYFGKYHCTGCHRNQMSVTPAKILQMWDFKCYPVSVFAYRLLEQIYTCPLFYVPDLNPVLYTRSKQLLEARKNRLQLKFIRDFIKTCRFSKREQGYFETIPDYITNDIDTWSLSDIVDARNESMQRSINELIEKCENHIFHCVLCTGRGFCCEYCLSNRVIYPWCKKVFRCDRCGSCFHQHCWKAMSEVCYRCQRIQNRRNESTETTSVIDK